MHAYAQKNAQGNWEVLQAVQVQHFVTVASEGDANKIVKMLRTVEGGKATTVTAAPSKTPGKGKSHRAGGRPAGYSPKKAVIEAAQALIAEGAAPTVEQAAQRANVGVANAQRMFKSSEDLWEQAGAKPTTPPVAEQPKDEQPKDFTGIQQAVKEEAGDETVHAQVEEEAPAQAVEEAQPQAEASAATRASTGTMTLDPKELAEIVGE